MSTAVPITPEETMPRRNQSQVQHNTGLGDRVSTESRCMWPSRHNWTSTCAVWLPPKAEPISCLLGSCAETVDIISTVTIKFAEPVSLPGAVLRALSVLRSKDSLPFY